MEEARTWGITADDARTRVLAVRFLGRWGSGEDRGVLEVFAERVADAAERAEARRALERMAARSRP